MRIVVTNTNETGKSYVESVVERQGLPTEDGLHEIFIGPLDVPTRPRSDEGFLDISPGTGAAMWRVFEFSPDLVYDMHWTTTVDFDVVIDGSMTLGLDEGDVQLGPGDAVLLRGSRHRWRAGPEGCRMLFALLGASERGDARGSSRAVERP